MSDNGDLTIGIAAKTDTASFATAQKAVTGVSDALAKASVVANDANFDALAKQYADVAKITTGVENALDNLIGKLKESGASAREIDQTTDAFQKYLTVVEEATQSTLELADAEKAVDANAPSAPTPTSPGRGGTTSAGGVGESFRKIGSIAGQVGLEPVKGAADAAAALFDVSKAVTTLKTASAGIPDALSTIGQSLGLVKTATEAGTAASTAAAAAEGLETVAAGGVAVASGGAAVGLGAMLIPLLPLAALAVAVAAGIALVSAAMAENQKKSKEAADGIRARYAAEKEIDDFANSGATQDEALKKRADLEKEIADNTRYSNEALAEKNATFAKDAQVNGDIAARLHAGNEVYKALDETITDSSKSAADATVKLAELNKQIEGGSFAAATAKEKAQADAEVKEKADQEAAQAREKAQRDAEAAANKKKAADEKAQRDAEAAAEKIKQAQESISKAQANYANKQVDLARQAGEKIADIRQSANDKAQDTDKKYYRDTVKIAEDARAKEFEAAKKADQTEADAKRDADRKLEDLRNQAIDDEANALDARNFLVANQAERGLDKANKQAIKEVDRAAEDRDTAAKREAEDRYVELQKARDARLDTYEQERADNKTALDRQFRDTKTQRERQENEAQIANAREIGTLQAHLAEVSGINQAFYANQTAMAQAAANGGSTQSGIAASGGTARVPLGGGVGGSFSGSFGGLRPINTSNSRSTTNIVTINTDSEARIIRILDEAGVLGQ